jgi:hypothetical protein
MPFSLLACLRAIVERVELWTKRRRDPDYRAYAPLAPKDRLPLALIRRDRRAPQ